MIIRIKKIYQFFKRYLDEIIFIFTNYILCNIPLWPVRKFFYRLQGLKIGTGSRIMMKTRVVYPQGIRIGKHTYINENCFLDGRSGIEIGDNVTIAIYSKLITGGHSVDDDNFEYKGGKIVIEDHVVVFADSVVLGGAYLKRGSAFSAKSLVRKGIYEESGIYGGNPAAYIRQRKSNLKYNQDSWHPFFR